MDQNAHKRGAGVRARQVCCKRLLSAGHHDTRAIVSFAFTRDRVSRARVAAHLSAEHEDGRRRGTGGIERLLEQRIVLARHTIAAGLKYHVNTRPNPVTDTCKNKGVACRA